MTPRVRGVLTAMAVALMVVPGARAGAQPPPEAPVPPLTDEDRRAAFPDVPPHRAAWSSPSSRGSGSSSSRPASCS